MCHLREVHSITPRRVLTCTASWDVEEQKLPERLLRTRVKIVFTCGKHETQVTRHRVDRSAESFQGFELMRLHPRHDPRARVLVVPSTCRAVWWGRAGGGSDIFRLEGSAPRAPARVGSGSDADLAMKVR